MINPLDAPGEIFDLALLNPNPTSSKTKAGPVYRVSFELDKDTWQLFMDAETKGMMLAAKAVVVGDSEDEAALETKAKGPNGAFARRLYQSSFLRSPDVWEALGTDYGYLAWVRQQKCAYCGTEQDIEAAHVRRVADGAGVGVKPAYASIPLCHEHHALQHQQGESALGGREWFDKQRITHVHAWAWERLKEAIGVESMTFADEAMVREWAIARGVEQYLPRDFVKKEDTNNG